MSTLEQARAALREHFGYPAFRAGQEAAVESVLAGKDTLVVLPTGGGKSLCFQVPAMILPKLTVVISPLISLMKDQVDALTARGLPATFINSTLTGSQIADRLARAQRGDIKLLYVAPERFDAGSTAERLKNAGVSLLAVDEAHCISEWGHDFRPSYLRIGELRKKLGSPPTVALTATATPHVRTDIVAQLALDRPTTIITGFDRKNLSYHVLPTRNDQEKEDALVHLLRSTDGLAVVYASTRKHVERIAILLERARISAAAYHAGLDDSRRRDVQDAFMTEKVRAIVATNAFGMGIDKPNVRIVVHYAMPGTLEAYYQEAGRAGRDGQQAACYLLHAFPDRFTHEFFIKGAYPERALVEEVFAVIKRNADATGLFELAPDDIATRLKTKAGGREVESAMRILSQSGAIRNEQEGGARVLVRLMATPARIKREFGADEASLELGLLRAMWRVAGDTLNQGAPIDLDGLPPGFGKASGAIPLLDALQARQFLEWKRLGGGTRLTDPRRDLAAFKIDWAMLDRRRRADLSKLDAMQQYAYTKGCRRGFVLRYFGDAAARSSCTGCDNCLGTRVEVERGGAPSSKRGAKAPIRRRPTADQASNARDEAPALTGADEALLGRLRDLRRTIAKAEQVPAYVVFPDRTLGEIAVRRPTSPAALGDIRGVGPVKLERYGERFLEVVRTSDETEAA